MASFFSPCTVHNTVVLEFMMILNFLSSSGSQSIVNPLKSNCLIFNFLKNSLSVKSIMGLKDMWFFSSHLFLLVGG